MPWSSTGWGPRASNTGPQHLADLKRQKEEARGQPEERGTTETGVSPMDCAALGFSELCVLVRNRAESQM